MIYKPSDFMEFTDCGSDDPTDQCQQCNYQAEQISKRANGLLAAHIERIDGSHIEAPFTLKVALKILQQKNSALAKIIKSNHKDEQIAKLRLEFTTTTMALENILVNVQELVSITKRRRLIND